MAKKNYTGATEASDKDRLDLLLGEVELIGRNVNQSITLNEQTRSDISELLQTVSTSNEPKVKCEGVNTKEVRCAKEEVLRKVDHLESTVSAVREQIDRHFADNEDDDKPVFKLSIEAISVAIAALSFVLIAVLFIMMARNYYSNRKIWAGRAYDVAQCLGSPSPGAEYQFVMEQWEDGRRMTKGHVRDLEDKWAHERGNRMFIKHKLDSLLQIESTVYRYEGKGSSNEEISLFCTFYDAQDSTLRAAYLRHDHLLWTDDRQVRSLKDAERHLSAKIWHLHRARMW